MDKQRLVFFVPGQPLPKARPRIGRGKAFTPQKTLDYEKTVSDTCWVAMHQSQIDTFEKTVPVAVTLTFYRIGGKKADIDNLAKAVLDGLNGMAYADDKQVVELHAVLHRKAHEPGVQITVSQSTLSLHKNRCYNSVKKGVNYGSS